ncbi:uncharacterized protein LOC131023164 [Salvia miltiorrhiza]|uniref:uncharacterized protein LOC131023164 n=1 Tax=Salvia miltiorrhiza TaxID=226208 RepID=UPI0025AD3586|nr:uncharacterized protein LOC131023164 [Salvia miltiorrhiza]
MATEILKIADDDDDVSILYSTPPPFKSGATKSDAISVDDYRTRNAKIIIDLSQLDDVVEIPASSYTKRRRFYKGESSNSKRDDAVLRLSFTCETCADEKPVSDSFRVSSAAITSTARGACRITWRRGCRITSAPWAAPASWSGALILGAEKFYCPYKEC